MEFAWTEEQLAFRESVLKFAQDLNQGLRERDRRGEFSRDAWKRCAEFGIQGLPIPEAYGGTDADPLTIALAMEALGAGCRDAGLLFSLHAQMWSVEIPILLFGTPEQKVRYLPGLCDGSLIGAHGMTEPEAGSDAFSLRTRAERRGDRYILNGTKVFSTNAPVADVAVVFATLDRGKGFMGITAFLVERDRPGLSVGRPTEKMGLRTSPMAELHLEECEVPPENLLGKEGGGAAIFNRAMEWERSLILASQVGMLDHQLEACVRYAKERRQFGQPIGKFQLVAEKIAQMKSRLEIARLLLYKVAWAKKIGQPSMLDAAIAKLYISEASVLSGLDAIQIHGGYGYTTEFEVERDLRDAIGSRLYSGTSEIQSLMIASLLGL